MIALLNEHDRIILTADLPRQGLQCGDVGTVVHVYNGGQAYKVEFVTLDGLTAAVAMLEAGQVRPGRRRIHPCPRVGEDLNPSQWMRQFSGKLETCPQLLIAMPEG